MAKYKWPRLFRYKGSLWFYEGLTEHNGDMLLVDIKDDSKRTSAKPSKCREIIGEEYKRQIEGIEYFKLGIEWSFFSFTRL